MKAMKDYITTKDLDKALDKQTDQLIGVLDTFMHQVDERFNKVEEDLADNKASIDRLTDTIDGFVKRLDDIEIEQTARDAQFERLMRWAKEVSKKTGISMPQL